MRQEEEYSLAFGGFDTYQDYSQEKPTGGLWGESPIRKQEWKFDSSAGDTEMQGYVEEDEELERQEREIAKWKGIYQEMSRRLKDSKWVLGLPWFSGEYGRGVQRYAVGVCGRWAAESTVYGVFAGL